MTLSFEMLEVSVRPSQLPGSIRKVKTVRSNKLGIGADIAPLAKSLDFPVMQPVVRRKPGRAIGQGSERRLTTIEAAVTYRLPRAWTTLVVAQTVSMDELVAAYLLNLRWENFDRDRPALTGNARMMLSCEAVVRLDQIITMVHYGGPPDWSTLPKGGERPAVSPLEALYYACSNREFSLEERTDKIRQYLNTGRFNGWDEGTVVSAHTLATAKS